MKFRTLLFAALVATGCTISFSNPASAGVQDFTIPSFEADYYLSRDTKHISHLQVTEHIVAEFPSFDQNHGILRAIPQQYETHDLNLKIISITDETNHSQNYTTSTQNGNLILKIGDSNTYVHGRQTYVISYNISNVTTKPTGFDGHFWDANGDQWSQTFNEVSAHIHLTPELVSALLPEHTRCFTGAHGSTASDCIINGTNFTTTRLLTAGETLTYELGFTPDTFAAYTIPASEIIKLIAETIFLGLLPPLATLIFVVNRWRRFGRSAKGRGTIIAEYTSPKDISVIASSIILREAFQPKAVSAQIIDLAVRHYLKIYELKVQKLLRNKTTYEIELIQAPDKLRSEEKSVLDLLFGENVTIGTRINLDTLAHKLYKGATNIGSDVTTQLTADGYFRTAPSKAKLPYLVVGFALIATNFFGSLYTTGLGIAGIILLIASNFMSARTAKGVELRKHLLGLKLYMQMAETDRIKMLQSPHGELTEKIDVSDTTQLVKLYELLLPYAMLFGIEKNWAKEFASLYQDTPDWYVGTTNFNAGYFAGSIANFGTASTSSFTAPSSSGSGGSAGGGGGGGGGGGW